MVRGADQGVGKLLGMIDDPAAGNPTYNSYVRSPASVVVEDLTGLLEAPEGERRRLPTVDAEDWRGAFMFEAVEKGLVYGHIGGAVERPAIN